MGLLINQLRCYEYFVASHSTVPKVYSRSVTAGSQGHLQLDRVTPVSHLRVPPGTPTEG